MLFLFSWNTCPPFQICPLLSGQVTQARVGKVKNKNKTNTVPYRPPGNRYRCRYEEAVFLRALHTLTHIHYARTYTHPQTHTPTPTHAHSHYHISLSYLALPCFSLPHYPFWVGHYGAQGRLIELKIGKFNCVTVLKKIRIVPTIESGQQRTNRALLNKLWRPQRTGYLGPTQHV